MMFGGGAKPRGGRMSSKLASDAVVPGAPRKYEQDSVAPAYNYPRLRKYSIKFGGFTASSR